MFGYRDVHNLGIHFVGSGPFQTDIHHSWWVQPGWIMSGDGMDVTTVQLVGNAAGVRQVACLFSNAAVSTDNVTIMNLTIDANWPGLSTTADIGAGNEKNIKTAAIALHGSNNLVDHVRAKNTYGSWANGQEQFAILLAGARTGDGTNNTIQFCRSEQPYGTYGNPFALAGWMDSSPAYLLKNSRVIRSTAVGNNNGLNTGFTSGGVNLANVQDCAIDSNSFTDCYGVTYIDTGSINNVQITNNTLVRGWCGVGLDSTVTPKQNITIAGNNLKIQNRYSGGGSFGIFVGYGKTTNLTINNNVISFDGSGGGMAQFWGISASLLNGATITNNTVPAPTLGATNGATGSGVTLSNNLTPGGLPTPGL
jgi:hypothetical protein